MPVIVFCCWRTFEFLRTFFYLVTRTSRDFLLVSDVHGKLARYFHLCSLSFFENYESIRHKFIPPITVVSVHVRCLYSVHATSLSVIPQLEFT